MVNLFNENYYRSCLGFTRIFSLLSCKKEDNINQYYNQYSIIIVLLEHLGLFLTVRLHHITRNYTNDRNESTKTFETFTVRAS